MPSPKEVLRSHNAQASIDHLVSYIDSAPLPAVSEEIAEQYARVVKIAKRVQWSLRTCDPDLIFPENLGNALNQVDGYSNSILGNLRDFVARPKPAALNSANANANELLRYLHVFQTQTQTAETAQMTEALDHFRRLTTSSIAEVTNIAHTAKSELRSLSEAIAQQRERLNQGDKLLEAQKGRLDQAIAEFQKQFTKTEEARRTEFAKTLSDLNAVQKAQAAEFDAKAAGALSAKVKELDDLRVQFTNTAKECIDGLEARRQEASDLVHVIGNIGVTGNYQQIANSERQSADRFRYIALALMGVMALGAILTAKGLERIEARRWRGVV